MSRTYSMKEESANIVLLGTHNIYFDIILKWILDEQDGGVD